MPYLLSFSPPFYFFIFDGTFFIDEKIYIQLIYKQAKNIREAL